MKGNGAFKSSAKSAAVAKAFAKILEKTRPDDRGLSILSVTTAPASGAPKPLQALGYVG